MPSSPLGFSVAGMASTSQLGQSHNHGQNLNTWGGANPGGSLSNSFTDALAQPRSHYQPGYLMSASQSNNAPAGSQRQDEPPVVPTKAKMNHVFSRGPASDFGMDSMFQSTRQRQALPDEDAPPMSSINDIPNEIYADTTTSSFQPRLSALNPTFARGLRSRPTPALQSSTADLLYIIVFGYPPDKFTLTVDYFKNLGDATEADKHLEIVNCFKLGYYDPADAVRALRKNGEVISGTWMVGVKWADVTQAEAMLAQAVTRRMSPDPNAMAVDTPSRNDNSSPSYGGGGANSPPAPMVGTPIRLAPASSAFRRTGAPSAPIATAPSTPVAHASTAGPAPYANASPTKGVLGQVSDMIFGW
ncbi:unnamed protein product [Mycena citricolor]|uniref:RRM Nup35-type domain-containing protein n=1 Tax=Mycena citricolor TaxID=2018698 RepID=A0AAD2HY65_9AGAR|nr:unnamed protein product [Mycena citricolor]